VENILKFDYPKNVRFKCNRCALCCGDVEKRVRSILLLKSEADRILQKTLMSLDSFVERVDESGPYIYRMKKTNDGKCVFLRNNLCSMYQLRPLICKFYPFQLKNIGINRYSFIYTDECPGIGRGLQLRMRFFERLFKKFIELMNKNLHTA
jgi:Fe-S-cluster containining protein